MTIGTTTPTRNTTGTVMRIVLTLVGAGMMVVGAFMDWVRNILGTNLSWKAFYSTDSCMPTQLRRERGVRVHRPCAPRHRRTRGIGPAGSDGSAGAFGIAGFVLFAIRVFRASGQQIEGLDTRIEIGAWLALAGSVIVLIAGFLSTPEQVVYET